MATFFGTISPITMCRKATIVSATTKRERVQHGLGQVDTVRAVLDEAGDGGLGHVAEQRATPS